MRSLALLLSLLCLASGLPAQEGSKAATLEARLEELRSKAQAERDRLRLPLQALIVRAELLTKPGRAQDDLKRELVALGNAAVPLMVSYLEPGSPSSDGLRLRAATVAMALEELSLEAVIGELARLAQEGSSEARRQALRVLGHAGEAGRVVVPQLVVMVRDANNPLRLDAFQALTRLGGEQAEREVQAALSDAALAPAALLSLAGSQNGAAAAMVLPLLLDARNGPLVGPLIAYFTNCPETLDKTNFGALLSLVVQASMETNVRVAALQSLPRIAGGRFAFEPVWRERASALLAASDSELRRESALCLALLGDKVSRRTLLKEFDEQIEQEPRYHPVYEQRGAIFLRLGEYDDALRDYKKALELSMEQALVNRDELYIGLARAQARTGRLREASESLDNAKLSVKRLRELALHEDFRELASHAKYGKVFPPPAD